jgi:PAS domain S-box-containing protein
VEDSHRGQASCLDATEASPVSASDTSQRRLHQLILEAAGEAIIGLDRRGLVTFANAAAATLLQYTPQELLGLDLHELVHDRHADGSPYPKVACPVHRSLLDGEIRRVRGEVLWRADGTAVPVEYVTTPIVVDDSIEGTVLLATDVTATARATEAVVSHRDALRELQEAIHPRHPELLDPDLGVRYVPADRASAGGDTYDLQLLADGSLHLAVLDVVGKGLGAVRDALLVVNALRLLAISGAGVGSLIKGADDLLGDSHPELAATAVVGRYQPESGVLELANGGHPPPLLIEPDGTTQYLEVPGRPIGWPEAGSDRTLEVTIQPGASVLFYTDGLVEADRDLDHGFAALEALASQVRSASAADMTQTIVRRVLEDAERHDDTLAVVVKRGHPEPR